MKGGEKDLGAKLNYRLGADLQIVELSKKCQEELSCRRAMLAGIVGNSIKGVKANH